MNPSRLWSKENDYAGSKMYFNIGIEQHDITADISIAKEA